MYFRPGYSGAARLHSGVAQWLEIPSSSKGIFPIEHLYKREACKAVDKSPRTVTKPNLTPSVIKF